MTVFIPVRDGKGLICEAICKVCGCHLVTEISEQHIFLLMMEHAADHDRK